EEEDDEVLPIVAPGGPDIVCRNSEPHNDFRLCAPHLGGDGIVRGRLDAVRGPDRDYYAFTVDRVERLHLVAEGPRGVSGALFTVDGRELAAHSPRDHGFVLEATLVPGRYYLRVAGELEGDYRIAFRGSDP
ncbi:MAG: hypothetical protein MI919_25955, partial [Holophagales bacterium]|nr:hypothetical protein [Holophagales bacterium]